MPLVRATKDMPSYQRGYARSAGEALHPGLWRGLVGAWLPSLGPTGGKLFDISGYGNHGTLTNMHVPTDWVPTEMGYALDYLTSTQHVTLGDPPVLNISSDITVAVWVNFSTSQGGKPIVARWGTDQSYVLQIDATDKIGFYIRVSEVNKSANSSGTYNDGNWHHLVGRFDGSNVLLTIDGGVESIVGDATTGPIDTPANNVFIGGFNVANSAPDAAVSQVTIYNRALSSNEIRQLYIDPMALVRTRRQLFGVAQIAAAGTIIPIIMAHGRRRR